MPFVFMVFPHEFLNNLYTCVFAAGLDFDLVLDVKVLRVIMPICNRKSI